VCGYRFTVQYENYYIEGQAQYKYFFSGLEASFSPGGPSGIWFYGRFSFSYIKYGGKAFAFNEKAHKKRIFTTIKKSVCIMRIQFGRVFG
jgi:hypothetical protein